MKVTKGTCKIDIPTAGHQYKVDSSWFNKANPSLKQL